MSQSKFITFEGIDGVGKSTQLELLYKKCLSLGYSVLKTRQPGGTAVGKHIRRILLDPHGDDLSPNTEILLSAADRAQHVAEMIAPALKSGKIVLCDRYFDSTVAYQGYGLEHDVDQIVRLNLWATEGILPTITFCLDQEPSSALKRTKGDRIERRNLDYFEKVRLGYHQIAKAEPERFHLIDATGTIDQVFGRIWSIIVRRGIL